MHRAKAWLSVAALAAAAHAQAADHPKLQRECAEWIQKKGYAVDYVHAPTRSRAERK